MKPHPPVTTYRMSFVLAVSGALAAGGLSTKGTKGTNILGALVARGDYAIILKAGGSGGLRHPHPRIEYGAGSDPVSSTGQALPPLSGKGTIGGGPVNRREFREKWVKVGQTVPFVLGGGSVLRAFEAVLSGRK